jgi:hypothetical protein
LSGVSRTSALAGSVPIVDSASRTIAMIAEGRFPFSMPRASDTASG